MLVDLQWDAIDEEFAFELRGLAEKYSEENTYHILLIGDSDSGKSTFVNNVRQTDPKYSHLPTTTDGIELSLFELGKNLVHVWMISSGNKLLYELEHNIHMVDGVLGLFDLTIADSFTMLQKTISELIMLYGKMFPLILIGNKADKGQLAIRREDVLVYAYEVGNASCHQVPYAELSAIMNYGLDKIIANMINMITCNLTHKCAEYPALVRQWCNVPSFYSFYNENKSKLEVLS